MLTIQLLHVALTTCLLLGQGQLVGTCGTVTVVPAESAPAETSPAPFLWLGMTLEPGESLLVRKVASNTLAERYGLRNGDSIAKVEGHEVASLSTLCEALADKQRPAIRLEVIRDCRSFEILVARPQPKVHQAAIASASKAVPSLENRSLNVTSSAGTVVIASRHVAVARRGTALTGMSAVYYDRDGKLVSLAYEAELTTVHTRHNPLPREQRHPAHRWPGSTGRDW